MNIIIERTMRLIRVGNIKNLQKEKIINSWKSVVSIHETTLRPPQRSALFKCLEYDVNIESESNPVIINMPTGTGKTGVIASLIFKSEFKRTLVVVPSDALRNQISNDLIDIEKYISWKVIPDSSEQPTVSKLESGGINKIASEQIEENFVIVATSQILNSFKDEELGNFLNNFERLIFDEAHHSEAPTWNRIRKNFNDRKKKIFQFTATPYRGDGKKLEGDLIYQYSVSKAFEAGIFEKIQFKEVKE
jgi:superfamily II DNA or RNA helicase